MPLGQPGRLRSPWWLSAGLRMLLPRTAARRELARVSPWLARLAVAVGEAPIETLLERVRLVRAVLSPDFVARFEGFDPYLSLYESLDARSSLRGMEPAKAMLYVWLRTLFANYHMAADRIDMAHAVEVRMPYLDHVLFEYASQIPIAQLAKDGQNKSLLREVARPWLSDGVRTRVKKPFLAPPATATPGNALHAFAQDTLRGTTLPFVDRGAVIRLLDSLPERRPAELQAVEAILMALVSLTILDRQYLAG
jgi:asparagine synthase (glutamine-hydrolysing)